MRLLLGCLTVLGLALAPASADEPPKKDPPAATSEIPPDLEPSAYVQGERPAPVERVYKKRLKKVWSTLLEILEDEGLHLLAKDRDQGTIQTAMKSFDGGLGPFTDVAQVAPVLSKDWPIWQPPHLNRGRYSLEILVQPDDRTQVTIRAYIEGQARHAKMPARFWAERLSNGTIENYFFDKLAQALE